MIPLPLTALHDTLKASDEPCTVLVMVTSWTLGVCVDGVGVLAGVVFVELLIAVYEY